MALFMKHNERPDDGIGEYEFRLQEEIHFWQHMIRECRKNDRNSELPRMFEAMALAEYRLLQLTTPDSEASPH